MPCNHSLLGDEFALLVREYQLMVHQANFSLLSGIHDNVDAGMYLLGILRPNFDQGRLAATTFTQAGSHTAVLTLNPLYVTWMYFSCLSVFLLGANRSSSALNLSTLPLQFLQQVYPGTTN